MRIKGLFLENVLTKKDKISLSGDGVRQNKSTNGGGEVVTGQHAPPFTVESIFGLAPIFTR